MKYTRQERLVIGKQIYDGMFSVHNAAEEYGISYYTAREYLRTYKAALRMGNPVPPDSAQTAAPAGNSAAVTTGRETAAVTGYSYALPAADGPPAQVPDGANRDSPQGQPPGGNLYRVYLHHLTRDQLEDELVEMKAREEQIRLLLG